MKFTTRENIVKAARSVLGTPWIHQGRSPIAGLDCLGVLIYVGHETGYFENFDYTVYAREPDGITLLREMRNHLQEIKVNELLIGDIPVIRFPWNDFPRHVGIIGDMKNEHSIIHSLKDKTISKVIEQPFRKWKSYTTHAFRFKHIIDMQGVN